MHILSLHMKNGGSLVDNVDGGCISTTTPNNTTPWRVIVKAQTAAMEIPRPTSNGYVTTYMTPPTYPSIMVTGPLPW